MSDIARARLLASEAHAGQTRKFSGSSYVAHPIRVADTVRRAGAPTFVVVAAMLHDVIEDTPVTAERIEAEFGPEVASLVRTLTRRGGEAYEDYIARIAADPWATLIKRADLTDNLATLPAGHDLAKRYIAALVTLHP